ncbi:MAG: hypothetical protein AAGA23_09885 [Pseudomonadota bacterium]
MNTRLGRWLVSAALLGLALLFAVFAWHKTQLRLAERAFDRWVADASAHNFQRAQNLLDSLGRLPDPAADWLRVRWLLAQRPDDPGVPPLLDRLEASRPFDYRPATARVRWLVAAGADDAELAAAFAAAIAKGPNESRVFALLFPLARLHWHRLPGATRQLIDDLALRTAVREPDLVIELGRDYGYGGVLCAASTQLALAQRACRRLGIEGDTP